MHRTITTSALFLAGALSAVAVSAVAQNAGGGLFPDLDENAFYTAAVGRFVRAGVLKGYDSGYFGPDDTVTRGQVAVMFDRYDQSTIAPMRAQIEEMRAKLALGQCGDTTVQTGENCDDGNKTDGDGCSALCSAEIVAPPLPSMCSSGGKLYALNETFIAVDGCNTCTCMAGGKVACTLMMCAPETSSSSSSSSAAPKKCVSDTQCEGETVCSVRYGDCESLCEEAACDGVCAGWCVPPEEEEIEEEENIEEEEMSSATPQAASSTSVAAGGACQQQMGVIEDFFSQQYTCKTDADCRLFRANCPYVTCGVAVSRDVVESLTSIVGEFTDSCNVSRCVSCADAGVTCKAGLCKLR
jgi:cysteine-rich repeat protein